MPLQKLPGQGFGMDMGDELVDLLNKGVDTYDRIRNRSNNPPSVAPASLYYEPAKAPVWTPPAPAPDDTKKYITWGVLGLIAILLLKKLV